MDKNEQIERQDAASSGDNSEKLQEIEEEGVSPPENLQLLVRRIGVKMLGVRIGQNIRNLQVNEE